MHEELIHKILCLKGDETTPYNRGLNCGLETACNLLKEESQNKHSLPYGGGGGEPFYGTIEWRDSEFRINPSKNSGGNVRCDDNGKVIEELSCGGGGSPKTSENHALIRNCPKCGYFKEHGHECPPHSCGDQ